MTQENKNVCTVSAEDTGRLNSKDQGNYNILSAALEYARVGFAVLPITKDKHPLIPNWQNDASRDERQICSWWNAWPWANVAFACGPLSGGLVVIDVDIHPEKDIRGDRSLLEFQAEFGPFPETVKARSGSGGYHYYFQDPDYYPGKYINGVKVLPGIDIRCAGGCIAAPPSVHMNGNRYEWVNGKSPLTEGVPLVNDSVLQLLALSVSASRSDAPPGQGTRLSLLDIHEGERNQTLFRYACNQCGLDVPKDICEMAAIELNRRFTDPLDEKEVIAAIDSAYKRYGPNGRTIYTRRKEKSADDFAENYQSWEEE